jgi:hypothetical protein
MEKIQSEKQIMIHTLLVYGLKRKIVFFLMIVALMVFILILQVMVLHLGQHVIIGNTYQNGLPIRIRFLFHVLDLDTMMNE